jgi:hypothetical protein
LTNRVFKRVLALPGVGNLHWGHIYELHQCVRQKFSACSRQMHVECGEGSLEFEVGPFQPRPRQIEFACRETFAVSEAFVPHE